MPRLIKKTFLLDLYLLQHDHQKKTFYTDFYPKSGYISDLYSLHVNSVVKRFGQTGTFESEPVLKFKIGGAVWHHVVNNS